MNKIETLPQNCLCFAITSSEVILLYDFAAFYVHYLDLQESFGFSIKLTMGCFSQGTAW